MVRVVTRQQMLFGNTLVIVRLESAGHSRSCCRNQYNPTLLKKISILPARICWNEQYFLADRYDPFVWSLQVEVHGESFEAPWKALCFVHK